jgi:hypothetical protein
MSEEDVRNQNEENNHVREPEQAAGAQQTSGAVNQDQRGSEENPTAENRNDGYQRDDRIEYRYHGSHDNHEEPHHQNHSEQQYNFRTPEYGRGDRYNQTHTDEGRDYHYRQPGAPKKHSKIGKEIGVFAAKAAIAAVIGVGVLALAGTIALNATNKNVYIVDKNKQVTIGDSGSNNSSGFPFGSFGFGGQGNGGSDGNEGNGSGNSGNNGSGSDSEAQQSDNDGPKLGVKVESMPDRLAKAGYPEGVLIAEVTKGGAADKAGLKTGDVITAFNGTVVKTADDLVEQVQNVKAGDTVKVNYKRMENGTFKAYDADVTFSDKSGSSSSDSDSTQSDSVESGAESSESAAESSESD